MIRLKYSRHAARAAIFFVALACMPGGTFAQAAQQQTKPKHKPASKAADAPSESDTRDKARAEVIRENNFGVALMNRQQFENALGKFQRACILDAQSETGCLNAGIALLNMQRFGDARRILAKY